MKSYPNDYTSGAARVSCTELPPSKARGGDTSTGDAQLLAGYPDLLTVQDLRRLTGLSGQTIRAEINGGNLPGCRIGRRLYVSKKHLLEYIENGGGLND